MSVTRSTEVNPAVKLLAVLIAAALLSVLVGILVLLVV